MKKYLTPPLLTADIKAFFLDDEEEKIKLKSQYKEINSFWEEVIKNYLENGISIYRNDKLVLLNKSFNGRGNIRISTFNIKDKLNPIMHNEYSSISFLIHKELYTYSKQELGETTIIVNV